jgi:hypothetical protein
MKKKCFVFFILLFVMFTSKISAQNEPKKRWNVAVIKNQYRGEII